MLFRVAVIGILLTVFHSTLVQAQCTSVSAIGNSNDSICASLHLFTDGSYTQRTISPQILRDSWIFAGVISNTATQLYDCWVTPEMNSNLVYYIMRRGCLEQSTFYKDNTRIGFYKFYGKFMTLTLENTKEFFIQCEATQDCPAVSGLCSLACQRDPAVKYLLTSVKIELQESGDSETTTVNLVIVLIVIGVCFFVLLLVVLAILLWKMMKKRRKRRRNDGNVTPILYNTTPITENSNGHQNGYTETPPEPENESFDEVYARVNKSTKGSARGNSEA